MDNVYLKILSQCLFDQGKGVITTLRDVQKLLGPDFEDERAYKRLRKLAATSNYSLVEAIIYSAIHNDESIDPFDFEAVWELAFGTDWRSMPVNRFHDIFPSTKRKIHFKSPRTAKSTFYALLYLDHQVFPSCGLITNLISTLEEKMVKEYPPLHFAKCILGIGKSNLSEFPFRMLTLTHRIEKPQPVYYEEIIGLMLAMKDYGFNSPSNANADSTEIGFMPEDDVHVDGAISSMTPLVATIPKPIDSAILPPANLSTDRTPDNPTYAPKPAYCPKPASRTPDNPTYAPESAYVLTPADLPDNPAYAPKPASRTPDNPSYAPKPATRTPDNPIYSPKTASR